MALVSSRIDSVRNGSFILDVATTFAFIQWIATCSNSGTASPSASLSVIQERLDLVSRFFVDTLLREDIVTFLRRSFDSQRLLQKFSLGRGDADDLVSLSRTIEVTDQISQSLSQISQTYDLHPEVKAAEVVCLHSILIRLNLDGPRALANRIKEAIDEEGLFELGRIEDTDAVEMAALAQDVLTEEGSSEDMEVLPKQMRTRVAVRKGASISNREFEDENTWIMRQRSNKLDLKRQLTDALHSASTTLQTLHSHLERLRQAKIELAEKLQQRLGRSLVTLGSVSANLLN